MIKIDKTNISITRGDSAYIQFNLKDASGNRVVLTNMDVVRCQVRDDKIDGELVFEGTIEREYVNNTITWHIRPEDTAELDFSDDETTYYWDAQVEFRNGDVFTFVDVSKFNILPEITMEVEDD